MNLWSYRPHVLVFFHIILCWDSICFKQSQLLVKFLPLVFRKMAIPHQSIWKSPTTPVNSHSRKMATRLSVFVHFPIGNGDIFQPSLCYPAELGSPAGFGAVGTSNSDGKTPGKPVKYEPQPRSKPCMFFVHIFVGSGSKDLFWKTFGGVILYTYICTKTCVEMQHEHRHWYQILVDVFFSPDRWVKFPPSTLKVRNVVSLKKIEKTNMFALLGVGQCDGARERERDMFATPVWYFLSWWCISRFIGCYCTAYWSTAHVVSKKAWQGKQIESLPSRVTVASHLSQRKIIFKSTCERGISYLYFSFNVS